MKVLLLKDVYKLGRAGDIKKVADGYGRNYLIPQGLALPATDSSIKLAERIAEKATERRAILNKELQGMADMLQGMEIEFGVRASETGKLYGSVSPLMIAEKIKELKGIEIDRHQIVTESIRTLGEYMVPISLTLDLIPEVSVFVVREGEVGKRPAPVSDAEAVAEDFVEAIEEAEAIQEIVEEVINEETATE